MLFFVNFVCVCATLRDIFFVDSRRVCLRVVFVTLSYIKLELGRFYYLTSHLHSQLKLTTLIMSPKQIPPRSGNGRQRRPSEKENQRRKHLYSSTLNLIGSFLSVLVTEQQETAARRVLEAEKAQRREERRRQRDDERWDEDDEEEDVNGSDDEEETTVSISINSHLNIVAYITFFS